MTKLISMRQVTWIAVLLVIALLSAFVMAPRMSSPEHHAETIAALDEKKMTVMELTAAMVTASVVIAAVPGDATDPVADQIMNLTSWLMTVVGVLFLEKFLVAVLGQAAFTYIIPIACGIGIIAWILSWESLKRMALKLGIFGLILSMMIPVSVNISRTFDETHEASIRESIEMVEEDEKSLVTKAKEVVSEFVDSVAVLMITTCVIPIGTILAGIWLAKLLFGLQFNLPKKNSVDIRKILKR